MYVITDRGMNFFNNATVDPSKVEVRHLYKTIGFREGEHGDDDAVTLSISIEEGLDIEGMAEHGDTSVSTIRKNLRELEKLGFIEEMSRR